MAKDLETFTHLTKREAYASVCTALCRIMEDRLPHTVICQVNCVDGNWVGTIVQFKQLEVRYDESQQGGISGSDANLRAADASHVEPSAGEDDATQAASDAHWDDEH